MTRFKQTKEFAVQYKHTNVYALLWKQWKAYGIWVQRFRVGCCYLLNTFTKSSASVCA